MGSFRGGKGSRRLGVGWDWGRWRKESKRFCAREVMA